MVQVQVVIALTPNELRADINLFRREDATDEEWELAKVIEGFLLDLGKEAAEQSGMELRTTLIGEPLTVNEER